MKIGSADRWGKNIDGMEKEWENGTKQVKTELCVTAAKLNFELNSGMGDKVGHASFRGRSAICTDPPLLEKVFWKKDLWKKDFWKMVFWKKVFWKMDFWKKDFWKMDFWKKDFWKKDV